MLRYVSFRLYVVMILKCVCEYVFYASYVVYDLKYQVELENTRRYKEGLLSATGMPRLNHL